MPFHFFSELCSFLISKRRKEGWGSRKGEKEGRREREEWRKRGRNKPIDVHYTIWYNSKKLEAT